MNRKSLAVGLVLLFIISMVAPMVIGFTAHSTEKYEGYDLDSYHISEVYNTEEQIQGNHVSDIVKSDDSISYKETTAPSNVLGPMDSAWPMYCHDTRHTGRSPYSTVDTWNEIWSFATSGPAEGGPTIDENGTIYIGSYYLNAVYQNGTLKWRYLAGHSIVCAPAIDENGIIYFGEIYGDNHYLYALYPNGTLKWKYHAGGSIFGSPAIGNDGTIYFGSDNHYINALYPNCTLKWRYQTGHVVYSSPAIGQDGTVYCGSHDTYLYALYPNNGSLKWKYKTGNWIRTSPCISDDGTIYVVSLDGYLHAINPDGSLKWKTNVGAGTSPTIGQDGTIYCGWDHLYAINPTNGSVKWTFDVGGTIEGGTPCNSVDGTIYVGTSDGGELIAINPDGTLKWRKHIGECQSAPAIGKDGTVYVGSDYDPGKGGLHAFGIGPLEADANGPYYGLVNAPVQFKGKAMGGYSPHSYHWYFGDTHASDEQNPTYIYTSAGNYTVILTVTDNTSNTSSDTTWAWIQTTNTPPNKPTINGPTKGEYGISYDYKFVSADPDGTPIWYYVDWGDNSNTGWFGPYDSGFEVTQSHFWYEKGTYTISCKAKDPYNTESDWGTLSVTMPCSYDKPIMNFLEKILERFPHAFPILRYILGQYKTFF